MRTEIDTNKIANIIADIQTAQNEFEGYEKSIVRLEQVLDDERNALEDARMNIRDLRAELDDYLDELIPEDGGSQSRSVLEY